MTEQQPVSQSKGFTNPALKAMGIPRIKLPSRNWMIFWSVLTVAISGVVYDKHEQKQIVKRYSGSVESKSRVKMETNRVPRKITVFIAPPPNDYLETSLKIWRRYIKPVLYSAGLDYDIVEEDKQGVIRTYVANEIRKIRKEYLLEQSENPLANQKKQLDSKVSPNATHADDNDELNGKEYKRNFDYRDLIGVFYKRPKIDRVIHTNAEATDPTSSGGVICLGRGAYKEYINGLHEGLLGPLEQSEIPTVKDATEELQKKDLSVDEIRSALNTSTDNKTSEHSDSDSDNTSMKKQDDDNNNNVSNDDSKGDTEKEETCKDKDNKVLVRFISPEDYPNVSLSEELIQQLPVIKNPTTDVPILLHQPVLMIPVPSLSGFTTIPTRIVRFYQRRFYTEQVCSQVTHLVNQDNTRPFKDPADLLIGVEEEDDWPNHWVKQGLKKNSEWVQPLKSDKRVTKYMSVLKQDYDSSNTDNIKDHQA